MRQSVTLTGRPAARRRTFKLLALALILVTLALGLAAAASAFVSSSGGGWFAQSSGTLVQLEAVTFSDAAHGWAVGAYGTILATTDGGAIWSAQNSGTTERLYGVAFSDATHGWAVGWNGTILATTDGGLPPVVVPTLTAFTPASGPVGTVVTLTGTGFTGATAVAFNGAAAGFTVDSGTQITAMVPAAASSGTIAVTTPSGTGTSVTSFTVTVPAKPKIVKLKPAFGKRGATVTISGSGFGGADPVTSSVRFGGKKCTTYLSWSAAQIKCRVPATAKIGKVKVTVTTAGGVSNAKSFRVKR